MGILSLHLLPFRNPAFALRELSFDNNIAKLAAIARNGNVLLIKKAGRPSHSTKVHGTAKHNKPKAFA